MGAEVKGGYGGGIPVVAFWTASVGEAVGHVETLPLTLSLPVKVDADGVNAGVDIAANTTLKPGETYSTPRSFVSVYAGDFYRAAAPVVERAAERRMGNSQAFRRSLQRELVRLGL